MASCVEHAMSDTDAAAAPAPAAQEPERHVDPAADTAPANEDAEAADATQAASNDDAAADADAAAQEDVPAEEEAKPATPPRTPTPPRPETPERTKELRARLAELQAQLAEKQRDRDAAKARLAERRALDAIKADTKAATTEQHQVERKLEDVAERTAKATETLKGARMLAARMQRLAHYTARVTSWIDTDLKASADADAAAQGQAIAAQTWERLQAIEAQRRKELATVHAMQGERESNNVALGAAPAGQDEPVSPSASNTTRTPKKTGRTTGRTTVRSASDRHVPPLPPVQHPADKAADDVEDYAVMNGDARSELVNLIEQHKLLQGEKMELVKGIGAAKRKAQKEATELQQRHRQMTLSLVAARRRMEELEQHNSSLSSSLQYATQALRNTMSPQVEERLITQRYAQSVQKSPVGGHKSPSPGNSKSPGSAHKNGDGNRSQSTSPTH